MYLKFFVMSAFMLFFRASGVEFSLETARILYGSAIVILGLMWLAVCMAIVKKDQQDKVAVTEKDPVTQKEVKRTVTFRQYDLGELQKIVSTTSMGIGIVIAFHIYKGFVTPLVLQAVMLLINFGDHKLFKLHILNFPALGALKRPFKEDNPIAKSFEQMRLADAAKAEKQAKKAAKKSK